jgi:hypothetical protein
MFRATLASVVMAACLAATGCSHFCMSFDGMQLGSCFSRGRGCPAPCCESACCDSGCCTADGSPCMGGPLLAPPGPQGIETGNLPYASPPRLAPAPQSVPTPYQPSGLSLPTRETR